MSKNKLKNVDQEIRIMRKLNHPNIVRLVESFQNRRNIHVVMTFAGKKTLKTYMSQKKSIPKFSIISLIFGQVLDAVSYLHSNEIAHRDLKLENLVISSSTLKTTLVDFGFSREEQKTPQSHICGTPCYMAPELLKKKTHFFKPVDMWALGVLLFYLLTKTFPYHGKSDSEIHKNISTYDPDYGLIKLDPPLRNDVVGLVKEMLVRDPRKRAGIGFVKRSFEKLVEETQVVNNVIASPRGLVSGQSGQIGAGEGASQAQSRQILALSDFSNFESSTPISMMLSKKATEGVVEMPRGGNLTGFGVSDIGRIKINPGLKFEDKGLKTKRTGLVASRSKKFVQKFSEEIKKKAEKAAQNEKFKNENFLDYSGLEAPESNPDRTNVLKDPLDVQNMPENRPFGNLYQNMGENDIFVDESSSTLKQSFSSHMKHKSRHSLLPNYQESKRTHQEDHPASNTSYGHFEYSSAAELQQEARHTFPYSGQHTQKQGLFDSYLQNSHLPKTTENQKYGEKSDQEPSWGLPKPPKTEPSGVDLTDMDDCSVVIEDQLGTKRDEPSEKTDTGVLISDLKDHQPFLKAAKKEFTGQGWRERAGTKINKNPLSRVNVGYDSLEDSEQSLKENFGAANQRYKSGLVLRDSKQALSQLVAKSKKNSTHTSSKDLFALAGNSSVKNKG